MSDTVSESNSRTQKRKFSLALNMSADVFKELYDIAVKEERSASDLACQVLEEWVAEYKKKRHAS